jgi:DNA-binding SARP family transcriptional activator
VKSRARARIEALVTVVAEALVFFVLLRAGGALGSVPWGHIGAWLAGHSAVGTFTALARLLGLFVSGWACLATVLYASAVFSRRPRLVRLSAMVTVPVLRKLVDGMAGVTVAASSLGALAGAAGASALPHAAVGHTASAVVTATGTATRRAATAPASIPEAGGSAAAAARHLPHPGRIAHQLPATRARATAPGTVPSEANGFAGLAPGTKVIVVRPGDCLSVIAERHLGDWRLDQEIEALNVGRLQPDGLALHGEHWIYPGWVLVLPPDAVGATTVGTNTPATSPRLQPPVQPPPTRPEPQGSAKPAPTQPAPARAPVPAERFDGGAVPPAAAPRPYDSYSGDRPRMVLPVPPAKAPVPKPATAPPPPQPGSPTASNHQAPGRPRTAGGGASLAEIGVGTAATGSLVAAGFIWRLERNRNRQRHARWRGQMPSGNRPEVRAAERRARAIGDREALRWVDASLRYLSGLVEVESLKGDGVPPSLEVLTVGPRGIEVTLARPQTGVLGWFLPTSSPRVLQLDADVDLDELEALAADRWNAWPALVALGEQEGTTIYVNLEHLGSVSVDGPGEMVRAVLSDFALQLGTQPWSDEMLSGVHVLGDSPLGADIGVTHVTGAEAMDLAEKLDGVSGHHQEMSGPFSISALRAVASEALPTVVLAFPDSHAEAVRCIAEASVPQTSAIALVAAGPCPFAGWRLVVEGDRSGSLLADGSQQHEIGPFNVKCSVEEVVLLNEALGPPSHGDDHHDEIVLDGPHPPSPHPRGLVEICVLGTVELAGGDLGAIEVSRRMAALSLIAYLASRERLVTADELLSALWPLDATKENFGGARRKTVLNVVSRARAILGYGPNGKERLLYSERGYRLSDDVTSDWARFSQLTSAVRALPPPAQAAALRQALELVRGEPFTGALSSQFFEWVASDHLDFTIAAKVVDAAQQLGELALEAQDYDTVMWAVEKGLKLEPTREELFRLWMHAFGRTGRPARVDDVYKRLKLVLRQRIHPLQEPQPESRSVWRQYTAVEFATNMWD